MTYLSRIRINPLRAESRKLLTNPRTLHGAIAGAVPVSGTDGRVLWRLDADDARRPHLLVLTPTRPDWTRLVEQAGWPDAEGEHAAVRDYAPVLDRIAVGREFAFRLTASPVQNTRAPVKPTLCQEERIAAHADAPSRRRGFRLGHRTAAAQLDWLLSRSQRLWGFEVPTSRIGSAAPGLAVVEADLIDNAARQRHDANPVRDIRITARDRHSFKKNGKGPHVIFHSATFEGRLRITDTSLFTGGLLSGIGPSKAYGCGLLTLAPLPAPKD